MDLISRNDNDNTDEVSNTEEKLDVSIKEQIAQSHAAIGWRPETSDIEDDILNSDIPIEALNMTFSKKRIDMTKVSKSNGL